MAAAVSGQEFLIVAGTASRELAKKVCELVGVEPAKADIGRFPNGEARVEIKESVRGKHVFVIQSTCPPVDENLMELLLVIDALRRASAETITAVIPYFGYAKQDKKKTGREPISAKLVADMLERAGAGRIVTIDLHAAQIEGFFHIPVENLTPVKLFAEHFRKEKLGEVSVVSPDAGGTKKARELANEMQARRIAIIDKYREDYSRASAMNVVGLVTGYDAIILDDFIDTAGTVAEAIDAVKNHKAKSVRVAATHALLTPPAKERLQGKDIRELVVTDTVPIPKENMFGGIKVISVAPMIADAIMLIMGKQSLQQYRVNR